MEFASLLMANPQYDPEAGHQSHHLRQHLSRTRRMGMTVREYLGETTPDAQLEAQLEATCERWLADRHGPQLCLGRPAFSRTDRADAGSLPNGPAMLSACSQCGR